MKKIIKYLLIIAIMFLLLVTLTACSSDKEDSEINVDEEESTGLIQSGTGNIELKNFIESPKILNKSWIEATMNEAKTGYSVNSEDQYATISIPGSQSTYGDLNVYFSGDEVIVGQEINGKMVDTYNENVSVRDSFGTEIRVSSTDIIKDEEIPTTLNIKRINFNMLTENPQMEDSSKELMIDNVEYLFPFIKDNKCYTLKDILNALGMQDTDKTIYEAIEKNIEYEAEYDSEYGKVSILYSFDETTKYFDIKFNDENVQYKNMSIVEYSSVEEDGKYSGITISIEKNI